MTVDDSAAMRQFVAMTGCVIKACEGPDALAWLKKPELQRLVAKLGIPRPDRLTWHSEIKVAGKFVPAIMPATDGEKTGSVRNAGARARITKPFPCTPALSAISQLVLP